MKWLKKAFPTPHFLSRPAAGVDISDRSVKCLELNKTRGTFLPGHYRVTPLKEGVIVGGQIRNEPEVVRALIDMRDECGLGRVALSLPEDQAYITPLRLPFMKPEDIAASVELQIEEHVPLSPKDAILGIDIVKYAQTKNEDYEVIVTAVPRAILDSYVNVAEQAGFEVMYVEVEVQALARAYIPRVSDGATLILDIGKTRTGISVVSDGFVCVNSTVAVAGDALTGAIARIMHVSNEDAESLKKEIGLSRAKEHHLVFEAMYPILSSLKDEVLKHISYWETHRGAHGFSGRKISKIILAGGQATLKGLKEFMAFHFEEQIERGNPWANVFSFDEHIPRLSYDDALGFGTAIGLALSTQ